MLKLSKILELILRRPTRQQLIVPTRDRSKAPKIAVWLKGSLRSGLVNVGAICLALFSASILAGDFNGDRKEDILLRNTSTGAVSIWLMNGGTVQSAVGGWIVASDWVVQGMGDFNGDGKSDILWRNKSTGVISIWLMNGGTIASTVGGQSVPLDWVVLGVGDFNGDGKSDIVWRNQTTGQVTFWLMNGGTQTSSVNALKVASDWVVQGVGDFNGDGKRDILWRNKSTGVISIWLMNGGAITSSVGGQTIASNATILGSPLRSVTLGWQENSSNETGFKIERSSDGTTNWTQIGATGAGVTTYTDMGLAPSTKYYYRVRAYNATGNSPYSNVASVTTQ